jgi:spore maturation protein CgeB
MNILLLGLDDIFANDIFWGFEELGHKVVSIYNSEKNFEQLMFGYKPDLLITFGSPSYYRNTEILESLKRRKLYTNAPYIHWDTDGITWKDIELELITISEPDIVFTVCPDMLQILQQLQITSYILPYAFCPKTHYPTVVDEEFTNKIAFVGSAYPEVLLNNPNHIRTKSFATIINPLLQANERIDFWGDKRISYVIKELFHYYVEDNWNHERCSYGKTNDIYSNCFINLVPQNHNGHLTKRTFEILGAGGFILTYSTPEILSQFTNKKELIVSSCAEQTLELVSYYKNNPTEYQQVRMHAIEASHSHTYKQRAEYMILKTFKG